MDDILLKMQALKVEDPEWSNAFNARRLVLNKETYTRAEVVELLNRHEDELFEKFTCFVRRSNARGTVETANAYTGECF
jgi:hypothetical protein